MKIFVLEDDPDRIRWFAQRFLGHDWTCIQTCDREYEFKPPYDLILLDHDLGGRQLEAGPLIRVHKDLARKVEGEVIIQGEHGLIEDCGLTFVRMIKDRLDGTGRIIVHSCNPNGAKAMVREIMDSDIFSHYAPFRGSFFNNLIDSILQDGKSSFDKE